MRNLSEETLAIINADPESSNDIMDPAVQEAFARRGKLAEEIAARDGIPFISAIVIAGDMASAERSERWVEAGAPAEEVASFVGSFARFDFIHKMWKAGKLTDEYLFERLPSDWVSADPDDTNPEFLALWKQARDRWVEKVTPRVDWDGSKLPNTSYVNDGQRLPKGALTVYRGQLTGPDEGPIGISWSLDRSTAMKFARTGGLRGASFEGVLLEARVPKDRVLAYLTGRGESEVIFDPAWLSNSPWSHMGKVSE